MGFLAGMFAREQRSFGGSAIQSAFGGRGTWSGARVNEATALNNMAVYACVRILSETVASLPLHVYERLQPRGKQRAPNHPLYELLHDSPNPLMTAFEFREALQSHLALWGNGYAEIETNARGQAVALWPLRPDKMREIKRDGNQIFYHYQLPDGKMTWLRGDNVWHLRGLSGDGLFGYSPIGLMRQAIGLAMATEEYGSRFFGNGARPGGVLEYPGVLSDDAYKKIAGSWDESHGGLSNAHRTAILEEGMTYKEIGMPPEDAQFLETRKFQTTEIARAFRVPPHMLADLERATFSNIEHQSISFVVHTIRPWLVRWEQSIRLQLMLKSERTRYFAQFLVDGLLRGDTASRYEAYATGRQNGWLSANDIREMENQNPIDDGGDLYLVPLNMIPANLAAEPVASSEPKPKDEGRGMRDEAPTPALPQGERGQAANIEYRGKQAAAVRLRLQQRYVGLYADVAGRVVRREANDIANNAKKHLGTRSLASFSDWLTGFYEEHVDFVRNQFAPLTTTYAGQVSDLTGEELGTDEPPVIDNFVSSYLDSMAVRHVAKQEDRLRTVLAENEADPLAPILDELERWRELKPAQIAADESVRSGNAFALAAYSAMGVVRKVWRTMGDNCPYCQRLDGKTIALDQFFLGAGESLEVDGQPPLKPGRNVGHAPAHLGCDCMIVAG